MCEEANVPNLSLGAVVVTVSFAVALVVVESSVTDVGLTEQLICAVEDERRHERVTVPVNPFLALTVMVELPDCPAETVTLVGLADTE